MSELSSAAHNRFSTSGASVAPENPSWHRSPSDSIGHLEPRKLKRVAQSSSSIQGYSSGDSIPLKKSRQTPRDMSLFDAGVSLTGSEAVLLQKVGAFAF